MKAAKEAYELILTTNTSAFFIILMTFNPAFIFFLENEGRYCLISQICCDLGAVLARSSGSKASRYLILANSLISLQ